jgi:diguanylate cyclase (GGDEF)-like protein
MDRAGRLRTLMRPSAVGGTSWCTSSGFPARKTSSRAHATSTPGWSKLSAIVVDAIRVVGMRLEWFRPVFTALLIDTSATLRGQLRDVLAEGGCVDIETMSLHEAIALAKAGRTLPDVIVLDLTGSELAGLEHLVSAVPDAPIIALCDEAVVADVLVTGATECSTKPVRPVELAARVRSALRGRAEARDREHRERRMTDTIVALQREKQDLERLVCVDPLTGIANRRHALGLLQTEWHRSTREHQPLGLVMIDLDCYHAYNEHYGHLGGDACLQRLAEAMVSCLRRPSDYLGRYGGEEFVAVLPNTDATGAKIVAERLRSAVEALGIPHATSACAPVVTITAGFASLTPSRGVSVEQLISTADVSLLHAKAAGRNRIDGSAPEAPPKRMSVQQWQRFAPVFADPWFVDRIPTFLADAQGTARDILRSLRENDHVRARAIATEMRAGARELSLTALDRMIIDLEHAIASCHAPSARRAVERLIQYLTHVQVIYRRPPETAIVPTLASAV